MECSDVIFKIMPVHKWPFSTISTSDSDFDPRNTSVYSRGQNPHFPLRAVGPMGRRLDLAETISFLDGHYIMKMKEGNERRIAMNLATIPICFSTFSTRRLSQF